MPYDYYKDYREQYPDDIEFLTDIATYTFPNELKQENLEDIQTILSTFNEEKFCQLISELRIWIDNNSGGEKQYNLWLSIFLKEKNFSYDNQWKKMVDLSMEKIVYSEIDVNERKKSFEILFSHTTFTKDNLNQLLDSMEKKFVFGISTFNGPLTQTLDYIISTPDFQNNFSINEKKELIKVLAESYQFHKALSYSFINYDCEELSVIKENTKHVYSLFKLFTNPLENIEFLVPKMDKQYKTDSLYSTFESYISPTNLFNYMKQFDLDEAILKKLFFNDNIKSAITQIQYRPKDARADLVFQSLNKYFEYYDSVCAKMNWQKIGIHLTNGNVAHNLALLEQISIYQQMDNSILGQDKKKMKI